MFSSVSCNHFVVPFHIMFIGIFHGVYIGLTAILYVLVMQWEKNSIFRRTLIQILSTISP